MCVLVGLGIVRAVRAAQRNEIIEQAAVGPPASVEVIETCDDPHRRGDRPDDVRVEVKIGDGPLLLKARGIRIAVRHIDEKSTNDVVIGMGQRQCRTPRHARGPGVEAKDAVIAILIELAVARIVVRIERSDRGRWAGGILPQHRHITVES